MYETNIWETAFKETVERVYEGLETCARCGVYIVAGIAAIAASAALYRTIKRKGLEKKV